MCSLNVNVVGGKKIIDVLFYWAQSNSPIILCNVT